MKKPGKMHILRPYRVGLFEHQVTGCNRAMEIVRFYGGLGHAYPDMADFLLTKLPKEVTCKGCLAYFLLDKGAETRYNTI